MFVVCMKIIIMRLILLKMILSLSLSLCHLGHRAVEQGIFYLVKVLVALLFEALMAPLIAVSSASW